ncbi:MAG: hypothetical protein K1X55_03860 [Chitinophagales bacterium]|nr:hypothetical protein [Chitinophagales bacterium]
MQLIKKAFQWLILTNLWIAIAATSFFWANCVILGIHFHKVATLSGLIFFSTWFVYQLSRQTYFKTRSEHFNKDVLYYWLEKHQVFTKVSIVVSGILTLLFYITITNKTKILFACIGLLALLYPLPLFKQTSGKPFTIRSIPYTKIFIIAFVWSFISVIIPATQTSIIITNTMGVCYLFLRQFMLILYITLPFDINDMQIDHKEGLKTIPLKLGYRKSLVLLCILSFVNAIMTFSIFLMQKNFWFLLDWRGATLTVVLNIFALFIGLFYSRSAPKWAIMLIYDGYLIAYFIIIFILNKNILV